MKIYTSEGIIFRTIKYSETSIICDIYTREKGLRSFIASGVRSAKSGSKAAIYRPLNIVELISFDKDSDLLSRIKEICLHHHYQHVTIDVILSSIAIFILEVSRNSIREKEANTALYDFLKDWLLFLDDKSNYHACLPLKFMAELSNYLGFGPMDNYSQEYQRFDMLEGMFCSYDSSSEYIMDTDESKALFELMNTGREQLNLLEVPKKTRMVLTEDMIRFYKVHIAGFRDLQSLEVLKSVL